MNRDVKIQITKPNERSEVMEFIRSTDIFQLSLHNVYKCYRVISTETSPTLTGYFSNQYLSIHNRPHSGSSFRKDLCWMKGKCSMGNGSLQN